MIAALGFASVDEYAAWVDGLSREQLDAHIVQLLRVIDALNLP